MPGEIQFNIRQMYGALQPILHHTTGIITHDGKIVVDVSYFEEPVKTEQKTIDTGIEQVVVTEDKKD